MFPGYPLSRRPFFGNSFRDLPIHGLGFKNKSYRRILNAYAYSRAEISYAILKLQSGATTLNPYRQIPESISKKRAVTQGISRKLFPDFFQILQCGSVIQKLFPGKFHEYFPMKKYFFPKSGHDSGDFPETFSNVWK